MNGKTEQSELLSDDDLAELLGVKQPSLQIEELRKHGLHPIVRRDGRPRVTWAAVTAIMTATRSAQPNWDSLGATANPIRSKTAPRRTT